MTDLTIQVKQIGRKRPIITKELKIDSIATDSKIKLKELIKEIVKIEVNEFQNRQKIQENNKNNILSYLSPEEIEDKAEEGKIAIDHIKNKKEVDLGEAISAAILAFEDGIYFVFLNEEKVENIDDLIEMKNDCELMFLRLTMLAGGIF
jgi:predicted sulfurtransferase